MEKITTINIYKVTSDEQVFRCSYVIDSDIKYEIHRKNDVFCILKYMRSSITNSWLPPREVFLGSIMNFYIIAQ